MKKKAELPVYLLLAFGLAWICQVGGCMALLQGNAAVYRAALVLTMYCPLAAVLIVTRVLGNRPTGTLWRPHFRGKLGLWAAAWFGPMALTLLGGALYYAIFPSRLDLSGSYLTALVGEAGMQQLAQSGITPVAYTLIGLVQAISYAPLINMVAAVGEEIGWRGFMMPRLKEKYGLVKGRLLGGALWSVWHWPVMLLVGYEYGTNYLGAPLLGLAVWFVVCFALGTLLDWLYEQSGCIWVPALAHGGINAATAIPALLSRPEDAYYSVLGPMPVGLIAILPTLLLAGWVTLREVRAEKQQA